MESPPGVNRDKDLRPHSPLAREDLKPFGFGMVPYLCRCDDIICAINQPNLLDNHAHVCLDLTYIRQITPNLSLHAWK